MIELVSQLIDFLSQESLSADDVAARVARLPGIRATRLSRDPDSGLPYLLTLEPERSAAPTTAELEHMLGAPRRARTHFDAPPELIFYPPARSPHWKIAVLVQVASPDDIESGPVTSIALRRDRVTN